jgi:hypothetical protein
MLQQLAVPSSSASRERCCQVTVLPPPRRVVPATVACSRRGHQPMLGLETPTEAWADTAGVEDTARGGEVVVLSQRILGPISPRTNWILEVSKVPRIH